MRKTAKPLDSGGETRYNIIRRCRCSSSGRAPPCQGGGSEFEPRHLLQKQKADCIAVCFLFLESFYHFTAEVNSAYGNSPHGGELTAHPRRRPEGRFHLLSCAPSPSNWLPPPFDFKCSGEINSPCAKVFAAGENACSAHPRRRPEGRWRIFPARFGPSRFPALPPRFFLSRVICHTNCLGISFIMKNGESGPKERSPRFVVFRRRISRRSPPTPRRSSRISSRSGRT